MNKVEAIEGEADRQCLLREASAQADRLAAGRQRLRRHLWARANGSLVAVRHRLDPVGYEIADTRPMVGRELGRRLAVLEGLESLSFFLFVGMAFLDRLGTSLRARWAGVALFGFSALMWASIRLIDRGLVARLTTQRAGRRIELSAQEVLAAAGTTHPLSVGVLVALTGVMGASSLAILAAWAAFGDHPLRRTLAMMGGLGVLIVGLPRIWWVERRRRWCRAIQLGEPVDPRAPQRILARCRVLCWGLAASVGGVALALGLMRRASLLKP